MEDVLISVQPRAQTNVTILVAPVAPRNVSISVENLVEGISDFSSLSFNITSSENINAGQ